ncbi:MAG: DUF423 domain-containing protein [Heyndrickxia faecalis]|jgi:uncharacterized membrane protein YgdD (TMEM256/DUF423 family)|uniref:DUF423 domain-containing protein n=1 Tax=Heyndrickxia faecalis TaxID=2824910 RepID=A0AAU7WH69_9BACI|nr:MULTISPECIES: DUF423 domain-containing protein [Heyndrickxia]APB37672.1 hypothetical protein BIZ35_13340 [Heyndrickxia coagulans]MCI1575454.1 DUF423 domain-containing protein [Heyndrickxia coagulans]MED4975008.1 DUF423 domain-containing protein [Weizmannia sp. CD-2023]NMH83544.1 DUF423 domain-containing protein [Heyndrickxia coagulans]QPG53468.1 DUF423 domain-containing protein [Heyndrickxia coagulans]
MNIFVFLGAINACISVALGAFGAHGLKGIMDQKYLDIWETGVRYEMYHALGLIAIGILSGILKSSALLSWSGWLMLIGIVLFSGSLYVLSLTKISVLGAITPIGGVAFLASWILLAIAAVKWM